MIELHNGDCMEALREMEENQFDLALVVDTVTTARYSF